MVIRGGYSLTFDRTNGVAIVMVPILGVGFAQTISCLGPRRDGACVAGSDPTNAFRIGVDSSSIRLPAITQAGSPVIPSGHLPGNAPNETLQFSIDPKLTISKSHSFDFTIQRELLSNLLLEVGYAGRLGRNLQQNVQLSTVPLFMKDPASGQTFAQAYDAVAQALRASQAVVPQPWFENQLRGSGYCNTFASCTAALASRQGGNFQTGLVNTIFTVINTNRVDAQGVLSPILNTQVSDLFVRVNGGLSNYHSGFVSLTERFSQGLSFTLNYTLSRALDQYGLNQENTGVSSYSYDLNTDYGPTLFDRKHVFNANWLYELPFGSGSRWGTSSSAANKVIGGWYVSGIYSANSGLPLTVAQHQQAFGGDPLNFAISAGAIPLRQPGFGNSLHTGVTGSNGIGSNSNPTPQPGQRLGGTGLNLFGNPEEVYNSFRRILVSQDTRYGRGVLRGFARWTVDLSIRKKTSITERVRTVFSFDLINTFNRVEFSDPTLDLNNRAAFGVISTQFDNPRRIQAGLRIEF